MGCPNEPFGDVVGYTLAIHCRYGSRWIQHMRPEELGIGHTPREDPRGSHRRGCHNTANSPLEPSGHKHLRVLNL
jgi:hypothetical protein